MATDTAAAPRQTTTDPMRHYWQVPVFLFGIVFFILKDWLGIGPTPPPELFRRDVADLRNAYEKVSPDRDELRTLIEKVVPNVDSFPDQAEMAHLVLGSGYARLAELMAAIDEARVYWMLAQQHFEQVRRDTLGDPTDKARLRFRFAKARAGTGLFAKADAETIREEIALLSDVPFGDDPGEAGRFQAELALQMKPPDLVTARDSLTHYLTGTGLATPSISLNRAKVLLGEVDFRLKKMDDAKKWLESIGADAPPDVIAAGNAWLARVHMAEGNWLGATRVWEAIRAMPNLPPALRTTASFQLGLCKLNTREPEAAQKLFEETVKGVDGPELAAAAFKLADLYLNSTDPAKHTLAADLLRRGIKDIANVKDLLGKNINPNEVVSTFNLAFSKLADDEAYDAAMTVVSAYGPIAEAGHDREERARILEAWSKSLQKNNKDFRSKASEAASEYIAFAASQPAVSAKADTFRKAAAMFKLAGDANSAVTILQEATALKELPDAAASPVWIDLADALLAANRPNEVWKAFNEAMKAVGPMSTKTRLFLARHFAETRKPEFAPLASFLFEQIANSAEISPEEQGLQEQALVNLGKECVRLSKFEEAEHWLRKQLHSYPTGPEALYGRLLLGVSVLQLAGLQNPPNPVKSNALREEALRLFRSIAEDIDKKPKNQNKLSELDSWLWLQSELRILQTFQQMRNPNELLFEASKLRERCRDTVEELIIMSLMYHAFKQKYAASKNSNDLAQALSVRDQMKEKFDKLPPSAFSAPPGEYSRSYWEKEWFGPENK